MRFDAYHPAINLLFFASVISCTLLFDQPVFIAIGYVAAFVYSVKLNGVRALIFNVALIPLGVLFVNYYSGFMHFGVTVVAHNSIGNNITLEAIVVGVIWAIKIATVLMWLSCVHAIFTADKVVYLLGRVSPRLSLLMAVVLRMVPRIKAQAGLINTAQTAIGRGAGQGRLLKRARNALRVASMTVTWVLEDFIATSDSMKSRGYLLRGRRAFSIYRFDARDRSLVIFMFICLSAVMAAVLLDQTHSWYNPEIVITRITPLSGVFYLAYACFCFAPFVLQLVGERRFEKMRQAAMPAPDDSSARFIKAFAEEGEAPGACSLRRIQEAS